MDQQRIIKIIGWVIFLGVIIIGLLQIPTLKNIFANETKEVGYVISEKNTETTKKPIQIIFTGDIMMNRGVETSVQKNYNGDFSRLFEQVAWFTQADIVFGNLEGPVSDIGNNVGSKYSFRMDPNIISVLKNAGFTVVSFANNHVGDWNISAFTDTLQRLKSAEIGIVGAGDTKLQAEQPLIIEKSGVKIGFIGFSDVGPNWMQAKETTPGILLASDPRRTEIITNAKSQVDFLIISYHWGDEYVPFNNRQKTLAESSVDAGADMIIGHHPHVIQDYTTYKDKLIFYSLGNFIFDQYFSEPTMRGLIVSVTLDPETKKLTDVELLTTQQDKTYRIIETRPFERENDAVLKKETVAQKPTCPQPPKDVTWIDRALYPVSKDFGLGRYIPKNLIPIPETIPVRGASFHCLTQETVTALEKMISDAKNLNLSLIVSSAYRSPSIQQTLFDNSQTNNPNQIFPTVAKPEHSEHQLGTAVDFRSGSGVEFTLQGFTYSPEYAWMREHAHLYGFVQSYPEEKETITGYAAESWHWRYVGVDHATAVRESGLTLYEYLKNLSEQ